MRCTWETGNNDKLIWVTADESQECIMEAQLKCDLGRFLEKTGGMNRKLQFSFCSLFNLIKSLK